MPELSRVIDVAHELGVRASEIYRLIDEGVV